MGYLFFRALWGRRLSYSLVFLEMIAGFLCLTVALGIWSNTLATARRARMGGPPETEVVSLFRCPFAQVEEAVRSLRAERTLGDLSVIYYLGSSEGIQWVAVDEQTAQRYSRQLSAGAWFRSDDFAPGREVIPVILGSAVYPDLAVGSKLPNGGDRLVVAGRLKLGQYFWIANEGVLDSIVRTDDLILTTPEVLRQDSQRQGSTIARLLITPGPDGAGPTKQTLEQSGLAPCFNGGPRTIAQAVAEYYTARRPQLLMTGVISLVILSIALFGFVGIAMVTVERRTREFAIRLALGATVQSLATQVLGEVLALSVLAATVGIPLAAAAGLKLDLQVSVPVILQVCGVGLLLGLLCALGPVLLILRRPPAAYLRNGRQ